MTIAYAPREFRSPAPTQVSASEAMAGTPARVSVVVLDGLSIYRARGSKSGSIASYVAHPEMRTTESSDRLDERVHRVRSGRSAFVDGLAQVFGIAPVRRPRSTPTDRFDRVMGRLDRAVAAAERRAAH